MFYIQLDEHSKYLRSNDRFLIGNTGCFEHCINLRKVTFAYRSKLKVFNESIFKDCINLVSLNIPSNVQMVKESSLENTNIQELIIDNINNDIFIPDLFRKTKIQLWKYSIYILMDNTVFILSPNYNILYGLNKGNDYRINGVPAKKISGLQLIQKLFGTNL